MISLVNRVEVPFTSTQFWECFARMDEHYGEWIPEHRSWRWLRGAPLEVGALWHADEWVGPMRIDARFEITASTPERSFSYRILGFPASFVRSGGSFELVPIDADRAELRQEVHFGFTVPFLGRALDFLMRLVLPIDEFRRHMREEGEALSGLVERTAPPRA